jgi:hypothetical protein
MGGATWPRAIRAILVVLLAATRAAADAPASLATLVTECYANGVDFHVCRSLEQLARSSAGVCRFPDLIDDSCTVFDGKSISPDHVVAYQTSWTHRALGLQRRLDDGEPLVRALIPGTHNSFNSAHYYPTVSGLDHNQIYSLPEQLDMDVRGLELDVHWMPSPYGDLADAGFAPVICHAQDETISDGLHVHPGCTVERHLRDGLAEIRAWLDAHPDQFLLLYLENHLDNPAGHAAAARTIEEELAPLVLKTPTGEPCAPMPASMSRADILGGGHQVLIVGNCGPGEWGSWVHERDQTNIWRESLALPPDYPQCTALHGTGGEDDYETHFIRFYEDSTWLSAMVSGSQDLLTVPDTLALVHCGVNLTGFDQLTPEDPRLAALVWSWAENEPAGAGTCAKETAADHRFRAGDCSDLSLADYACRFADGSWTVAPGSGGWSGGFAACSAVGGTFAVPKTGYDNERLVQAGGATNATAWWLDYAVVASDWIPDLP